MPGGAESLRLSLLERFDLAWSDRLVSLAMADGGGGQPDDPRSFDELVARQRRAIDPGEAQRTAWIVGALGLRGFVLHEQDVRLILDDRPSRFLPQQQEHGLVRGLDAVLDRMLERGAAGQPPCGWSLVEMFRTLTASVARFRNNHIRRDRPWDSIVHVSYPDAAQVADVLDEFSPSNAYRDVPETWNALHPVRQAFRTLWRFGRIAPFPDLNLVMAFVCCNAYLLAHGYPLLFAERTDRAMLMRMLGGPPPRRIVQFESRLLAALDAEQPSNPSP